MSDADAALEELHAEIYREKILRACNMTIEQRLAEVFELSDYQFEIMLAGRCIDSERGMKLKAGSKWIVGAIRTL